MHLNKTMKNGKIHVSKLIEEHSHNTGGTGIIENTNKHIMIPNAKTKLFEQVRDKGRVGLYGVEYTKGCIAYFYVIYGHTNGDEVPDARSRTDEICKIVLAEIAAQEPGPTFIVGDINASIHNIASLQQAIDRGTLIDLGARASIFGGIDNQETCKAKPTSKGNRRDYVFTNQMGYDIVQHFEVDSESSLKVHSVLILDLKTDSQPREYDKVCMPESINKVFYDKCEQVYGQENLNKYNKQKDDMKGEDKKAITIDIVLPQDAEGIEQCHFPNKAKSKNSYEENVLDNIKTELHKEEESKEEQHYKTKFTREQIMSQKEALHKAIDTQLNLSYDWDKLLQKHDTNSFMMKFANAIEKGVSVFAEISEKIKRISKEEARSMSKGTKISTTLSM
jgi:hypothetical protein